jgi:hypothetical protein
VKIIALLIIIILSACISAPEPAPQQAVFATANNTITPSPVPSPTLDYLATAQAERDTAVNAAEAARRAELDAQQGEIYAQETSQMVQLAALQITATMGAQTIELAAIRATDNVVGATRQADQRLMWQAQASATAQAPAFMLRAAQAEADANNAQIKGVLQPLASLILSISALGMVVVFWAAIAGRQHPEIVTIEQSLPVTHIHTAQVSERIDPPDRTPEQWSSWSTWMLAGGSASVAEWETSVSPFRGSEYRMGVYKWAVKNKMIAIVNRIQVLTDRGREYCTAHAPPSPGMD